jgi:hypothetical protein
MKGVVFTEFLEMVEGEWGFAMVDRIIDGAELPHDGTYVATGTYDHAELVAMVMGLSEATGVAVPDLVRTFGEHLFRCFADSYGVFFDGITDSMSFLEQVHDVIHVEVRKLYPDAELPSILCERGDAGAMDVHYRSSRSFGDLAEGLIVGCIRHFEDDLRMHRDDQPSESGSHVIFRLQPRAAA